MTKPRNQSDVVSVGDEAFIEGGILRRYQKLPGDTEDVYIEKTVSGITVKDSEDPGMVTISDYVRESSPPTELLDTQDVELDCAQKSLFRKAGGTCTITFTNMVENQQINLAMESTGSAYTLTFSGEVFRWPENTQPTPTESADKVDIYSFIKIAGTVYGNALLSF